ncbi:MAG: hypothetical protein JXP73_04250 [Deltaproteobacteria bacterium]|nr:hypothetical protein [Deltaproteobacteria bacterium]
MKGSTMKSAPSDAFRRLCLAMALLATTWALPSPVQADAYGLQTVKNIADVLKPNVLVVLETAESMQGLPGENAARYNEVGADCEDGNRNCRLANQVGRWGFSGMGSQGIKFGDPNASCTATVTNTVTNTNDVTLTDINIETVTNSSTSTITNTNTNTGTKTDTQTQTDTKTTTATRTNTSTVTNTATNTNTTTGTTTATVTQTNTDVSTGTVTTSETGTTTNTTTGTGTKTVTNTGTKTQTNSSTGTGTGTNTSTRTQTNTGTGTKTVTSTRTQTGTVTNTQTSVAEDRNLFLAAFQRANDDPQELWWTSWTHSTGTDENWPPEPHFWALWSNGYVQSGSPDPATLWFPPGTYNLYVTAKGTPYQGTYAHFVLTLDGTTVGSAYTTASVQTYTFSYTEPTQWGANRVVRITFDNDASGGGGTSTTTSTSTVTATTTTTGTNTSTTVTNTGTNTSTVTKTVTNTSTGTGTGTDTGTDTGTQTATATDTGTQESICGTSAVVPFEAEDVWTDDADHRSYAARAYSDSGASAGEYVLFMDNPVPSGYGEWLAFDLAVATTSTYMVKLMYKRNTNRAQVQTSIDGVNLGGLINQSGSSLNKVEVDVGTTVLSAGTHRIRFTTFSGGGGTQEVIDKITLQGVPGNCTATATSSSTSTGTGTDTATESSTYTGTATATGTGTETGTETSTDTETGTGTHTSTETQSETTATTETATSTGTITTSSTSTGTDTSTGTESSVQVYACGSEGSVDPDSCTVAVPTTSGYCNEASNTPCSSESACNYTKGDFCRYISTLDGSGRLLNETCFVSGYTPWGSCKHGRETANTSCSDDTPCTLAGDYCTEGQPAKMCSDSGLWCTTLADCPGNATTDQCVGATSRMMTVKHALRRAVAEYADKVNFGFMNTYQGRGIPATATDASTAIYPYVKLQDCPPSANVTETKLLTRGELEKAGCFSLASGPADTCTVDYGGNGALNATASWNQVTYTKVGTADSRWLVPRADGSGKFNRIDTNWSSCSSSAILPACVFAGQGTGLYEGSYYSFTYKQGTPIADGEGSRAHPVYFTTYRGKYFSDGGYCYNAIDADRSDIVNDGIFGRPAYTGHPYDSANEVPVPWSGSNNSECNATTGASWNSNVVPMLSSADTVTFGGQSLDRSQRALMIAARLEKASFGGVHATSRLAPIGCALSNEGASDANHSAAAYMSTARANDAAANDSKPPCWSNNIVLVVDGHSNGPGDMDQTGTIDCASTACAYDPANPTAIPDSCNCEAIKKAYALASSGIQTHVVVNAPATWSTRYPYTYAFLWNLAVAGSPNRDGTPGFGITPEEVYRAISDKIAAAAYHFPFTTGVPVAGATTMDPDTLVLTQSRHLFDASVSYPSWKGTVRAFDAGSGGTLLWDAATVAAGGHPATWKNRRIYFGNTSGGVVKVQIDGSGNIGNAAALYSAGLGSSSAEAEKIVQWLLGKPELGNRTPLMGPPTLSTPIVVGQGAANGLNGSPAFSTNTWKRPQLLYVGADDGMLHAFFAHSGSKTLNGATYLGGEEAFAFIPNDMLPVIAKLFAQGGQHLAVDKDKHVFGLAGSPKVKDMCIGSACETSDGSDWHTVLVMTEGPGGNKPFALDITNVVSEADGLTPDNLQLRWRGTSSTWNQYLGETTALPGFYFAGYSAGSADNRVLFASGYGSGNQGLALINADAANGTIKETRTVGTSGGCSQRHTVMSDVATARDYSSASTSQNLLAAYVSDTWGDAYQYVPGALAKLYSLGCAQPLYFSPAVVQLDRAPRADTSSKRLIYLVQVTNSNLDPATALSSTVDPTNGFPGSKLVVTKLDGNVTPPIIVTSYNPHTASGQIVLSTDATTASDRICVQSDDGSGGLNQFANNAKTEGQTCADVGGTDMPATARPVGTPLAVLRADGLGFQVITSWYDWNAHANDCSGGKQFDYGTSYITVHEFGADGTWYQVAGIPIGGTVVTGVGFVVTGLFVNGINPSATPQSLNIGQSFSTMQQMLNNAGLERYGRTSWSERLE